MDLEMGMIMINLTFPEPAYGLGPQQVYVKSIIIKFTIANINYSLPSKFVLDLPCITLQHAACITFLAASLQKAVVSTNSPCVVFQLPVEATLRELLARLHV